MEPLLYAKRFHIIHFFQSSEGCKVNIIIPFYRCRNWGSGGLNDLPSGSEAGFFPGTKTLSTPVWHLSAGQDCARLNSGLERRITLSHQPWCFSSPAAACVISNIFGSSNLFCSDKIPIFCPISFITFFPHSGNKDYKCMAKQCESS